MKQLLKITKQRLKNHIMYSKWYYLVGIILIILIINFSYIVTRPEIPAENKVNIIMYAGTANTDVLKSWEEEMLSLLPDDQREVNILSRTGVAMNADAQMAMTARLLAGEDDIIITTESEITDLAYQGAFLPLDEYMDIDELTKVYKKMPIDKYQIEIEMLEDSGKHIYWLPLSFSEGFEEIGFPSDELTIGVTRNTENAENAIKCLEYLIYK